MVAAPRPEVERKKKARVPGVKKEADKKAWDSGFQKFLDRQKQIRKKLGEILEER